MHLPLLYCAHTNCLDPIFKYVNNFRVKQHKNGLIVLLNKVDVIKCFLSYVLG